MTDSAGNLRHKIASAGDLHAVVRTMKALAASSITQYENSVHALSDYYRTVELGLSVCFRQSETGMLTMQPPRSDQGSIGIVVFGSDQGLVGKFNEQVVDYALAFISKLGGSTHQASKNKVWAVGERAHARLIDAHRPVNGLLQVPNSVQAIASLVGELLLATESGRGKDEISTLYLFYNRTTSGAVYEPVTLQLLPLDDVWQRQLANLPWPTEILPEVMADNTATLRALIREYLFISIFRACAESLASENASRLASMQRAEKNIDELLEQLQSTFHRVRQSAIDEELFDVTSGFEALSNDARS